MPGYHDHGHLATDEESDFHIELPTDPDFLESDLTGVRLADVRKAEE